MKKNFIHILGAAFALTVVVPASALGAGEDMEDSPWGRRMDDVTGLFGARLNGSAVNAAGSKVRGGFDTFTPFQDQQQTMVGAYGATEVGVGCNGLNLGTVLDGQLGQYAGMVEQFMSDAPTLAIMYLAYSQPTVKSVIDELNVVGQFGLDLSNMTCSGVREQADKAYEQKKQSLAEADCTAEAGYKSAECMSGDGISGSLIRQMGEMKEKASSRAGALMGRISSATGGLVGINNTPAGGSGTGGTGGAGAGRPASKTCTNPKTDGTTALVLAASEMGCADIKKYSGLLPTYSSEGEATTVTPRTQALETVSKTMTAEYMDLYTQVYSAPVATYQESPAYKELVNRGDIVISEGEFKFMRELSKANPAIFANAQRNLATLAMMKELDSVISKIELGVLTGLSNQPDSQLISQEDAARYQLSAQALRKEYEGLQAKIQHDIQRNQLIQATARSVK